MRGYCTIVGGRDKGKECEPIAQIPSLGVALAWSEGRETLPPTSVSSIHRWRPFRFFFTIFHPTRVFPGNLTA